MSATAVPEPLFSWPLAPGAALVPRTVLLAEAYHELMMANQDRLAAWEPWALGRHTPESTRSFLESSGRAWLAGHELPTAIVVRTRDGWALAGSVALRITQGARSADIGYWVDRRHEGRGLVTAASTVLLNHGFGPLGLERVTLRARVDNLRSRAVARRLGFREEGVLRQAVAYPTRRYDEVLHGLLADEWCPPRVTVSDHPRRTRSARPTP